MGLDLTVVMPTFNDSAFAKASLWALRRYHPDIPVIIVDGGSYNWHEIRQLADTCVCIPDRAPISANKHKSSLYETRVNVGVFMAETTYVLIMSPDVKVTSEFAIPLMVEALDQAKDAAETGGYGVKVVSWDRRIAFVGTEFTRPMELDACPGHIQMHRREAFLEVGGYQLEDFYAIPEHVKRDLSTPGAYSSDLEITNRYKRAGYRCVSPRRTVEFIHWGSGSRYEDINPFSKWWLENIHHIRCNPLNDWSKRRYLENGIPMPEVSDAS